jgi:hypothetical protein
MMALTFSGHRLGYSAASGLPKERPAARPALRLEHGHRRRHGDRGCGDGSMSAGPARALTPGSGGATGRRGWRPTPGAASVRHRPPSRVTTLALGTAAALSCAAGRDGTGRDGPLPRAGSRSSASIRPVHVPTSYAGTAAALQARLQPASRRVGGIDGAAVVRHPHVRSARDQGHNSMPGCLGGAAREAVRIGQPRRDYIWRVAPGVVDLPVRLVSVAAYQPADSRSPSPQAAAATTGDHLFYGTS